MSKKPSPVSKVNPTTVSMKRVTEDDINCYTYKTPTCERNPNKDKNTCSACGKPTMLSIYKKSSFEDKCSATGYEEVELLKNKINDPKQQKTDGEKALYEYFEPQKIDNKDAPILFPESFCYKKDITRANVKDLPTLPKNPFEEKYNSYLSTYKVDDKQYPRSVLNPINWFRGTKQSRKKQSRKKQLRMSRKNKSVRTKGKW